MEEKLYTIPLNDAINEQDECPLCVVRRNIEHDLIDYVLGPGASYMESDTRADTDREGFCRQHFKMMFDYGNALGNARILKTHYKKTIEEMNEAIKMFSAPKNRLFGKSGGNDAVSDWIAGREKSCYICRRTDETYERYLDTFFILYKKDISFREKFEESKGFCLHHLRDVCSAAAKKLDDKQKAEFYPVIFKLMQDNMQRVQDDISWFVEKFDYIHTNDPWKNSRDAIQRGMQKLESGYPADPVYKNK